MVSFFLVDDYTILRNGIARLLKPSFPGAMLGEAGNGDEALLLLRMLDILIRAPFASAGCPLLRQPFQQVVIFIRVGLCRMG